MVEVILEKMKICILQGAFLPVPPVCGGAVEKMWFLLSKEFVNLGHEVLYISRSYKSFPEEEEIDGVRHLRVSGFETPGSGILLKFMDLLYTKKAVRLIPDDVDVIVTNTFFAPVLLNSSLVKRAYVDVARMPKGQMRLYRKVGKLRANSTPVAEAILKEISSSRSNMVSLVPNPLPFKPAKIASKEEEKNGLLYCGRVHPEKGLDLLIESLRMLPSPPSLRVVGPWKVEHGGGGEEYYRILKAKSEGLSVDFLGPIFDLELLNQEYRRASVFVYPSLAEKGETFGLAPLEAMAWGCVPIVSDLACFRDFIIEGENGLFFDHRGSLAQRNLSDAILRLGDKSQFLRELSKRAIKVRETHSSEIVAQQFIREFEKLNEERKRDKCI